MVNASESDRTKLAPLFKSIGDYSTVHVFR